MPVAKTATNETSNPSSACRDLRNSCRLFRLIANLRGDSTAADSLA
jgi:hypothetical protein